MRIVLAKYRALKQRLLRLRRRAAEHRAAVRLVRCATTDDIKAALEVVYCRHNVPVEMNSYRGHRMGHWQPGEIKMAEHIMKLAERHAETAKRIADYEPGMDREGAPGGMGERKGVFTE